MNSALRINAQPVVMPLKALAGMRSLRGAARPETHRTQRCVSLCYSVKNEVNTNMNSVLPSKKTQAV
jgi:hypothetical protein